MPPDRTVTVMAAMALLRPRLQLRCSSVLPPGMPACAPCPSLPGPSSCPPADRIYRGVQRLAGLGGRPARRQQGPARRRQVPGWRSGPGRRRAPQPGQAAFRRQLERGRGGGPRRRGGVVGRRGGGGGLPARPAGMPACRTVVKLVAGSAAVPLTVLPQCPRRTTRCLQPCPALGPSQLHALQMRPHSPAPNPPQTQSGPAFTTLSWGRWP